MESTFEKKCYLCNVTEIDGSYLVDSKESSLILCEVLNVPHLMNDLKKLENVNYCHPCKQRILKIHESLDILKKLEKEVLEEKHLIRLQLETNYRVVGNEFHYSQWDFGVELVNEIKYKSINSLLEKAVKNQIDRKFRSKRNNYRIMKNITITENQKLGTFEEQISKDTTPLIDNIIPSEKKPFINDYLSIPGNSHFVDSVTNSPLRLNHAEMPLTSHVYDFDEIKLEFLSGETNNIAEMKDPFEGIFAEPDPTPQNIFVCGTCDTNFDDYSQLDEHFCTHISSKFISFDRNEFVSKVSLNTKPFKCGYCDKTFRDPSNLKSHENIHKEKTFKCKFCGKNFSQKSCVVRHERIHTSAKPFKCGYCHKTFRDLYLMKMHERIHTEEKPFQCNFCEKGFYQKHSMETHKRTHTNEKPFKCKFCGNGFSQKSDKETHERIHTNEKPFKCKCCEKGFSQKSNLERHERIHTDEKPFKCRYCEKTFRGLSTMKRHEHIHKDWKRS